MKYYIIAGEASGDLHGSNLVREIKKMDSLAEIRCWGGDLMNEEGAILVKHYRDLAFMGFAEVIGNLPAILGNLKFCKQDIRTFNPDVLILIDYPGFNLRIAKWAKENGFRVVYYISPQVWAWKESRVKTIRRVVDRMLVILPFEKEFYEQKWDYKAEYVGHPLVEVVNRFIDSIEAPEQYVKPVVALLPGSRKQEISAKLPVMLEVTKQFPGIQFVVAKAASVPEEFYHGMLDYYPDVSSVKNKTYALLSSARAAVVTSGTATLETALFNVPQVVCYKGSTVSYYIAKMLIRIKYISLVNLIMDKPVVKELIQSDMTAENIAAELNLLLYDRDRQQQIRNDYQQLKQLLQKEGNASRKAAELIISFTKSATKIS